MGLRDVLPGGPRLPGRVEDLRGPWQGIVVLPVHLTWHGLREFDVAAGSARMLMYSIVISQGRPGDLARFINARRLREDWPQLRDLLSARTRRAFERKLGLRAPAGASADPASADGASADGASADPGSAAGEGDCAGRAVYAD